MALSRSRGFRIAAAAALVGWVAALLVTLVVAGAGAVGLSGAGPYRTTVHPLPFTDLVEVSAQPSWTVLSAAPVCRRANLDRQARGSQCYRYFVQHVSQQRTQTGAVRVNEGMRPTYAHLSGTLTFSAPPGWNALMAALYAMMVISGLVVAFVLFELWRLLRTAARGEPFAATMVRRLRTIALTLIAWQVLQPVYWLFFSPKALDYGETAFGVGPNLQLGSMEPGFSATVLVFGLLLLLLAVVFRHGSELEEERRLTV